MITGVVIDPISSALCDVNVKVSAPHIAPPYWLISSARYVFIHFPVVRVHH